MIDVDSSETDTSAAAWERKPLLRRIYAGFYERILEQVDPNIAGPVVEIGSGIGNLKTRLDAALTSDKFIRPWLDLSCDAYCLPFRSCSVAHLVLFDVFHHLRYPFAFFEEARRVMLPKGRIILFEPFISVSSFLVYGLCHREPIGWFRPIAGGDPTTGCGPYYAAQGNATRVFFGRQPARVPGFSVADRAAFACFSYLASGGYSAPTLYPSRLLPFLRRIDFGLTRWPSLFGGRCIVTLVREPGDSE